MLHQLHLLIESSVSKRKVQFGAGWKSSVENIFFSKILYFGSNYHVHRDINFGESSILKRDVLICLNDISKSEKFHFNIPIMETFL